MRRILTALLASLIAMSLLGCGGNQGNVNESIPETAATTAIQFDLDAYKESVSTCATEISNEVVVLNNVVKKEADYLKIYNDVSNGKANYEGAVETAMKWLEEKSDYSAESIEEQYNEIAKMYKDIVSEEITGAEAEELKEVFDELFTAYIELHSLALSPSGSLSAFIENCNDCIDTIKTDTSKLDILLS